jgi:signal transduction histidine kinase/ligand-binding sensor domain-containing protein
MFTLPRESDRAGTSLPLRSGVRRPLAEAEEGKVARAVTVCVLFLLFTATSALAVDPGRRISQYAHTAWRIQDGIFSGAPNAITQTADGYLWIGTQTELVRFDGVRFVRWTPTEGKPGLLTNSVFSLLAPRDGSLWIGTGTNLARLKDGDLVNYTDGLGRINSILEDRQGRVWIVRSRVRDSTGPLCQVTDAKLRCFGKEDGIPFPYASSLAEDSEGNFWIGSSDGLTRWRDGSSDTYSPSGLKSARGLSGVAGLAAVPDGSLWFGISSPGPGLGLQQMTGGTWKPFVTPELDGSNLDVSTLFLDRQNTLWVGTGSQGIYRIHNGQIDRFRSADGLSSDTVKNFYEDREGNLWVATTEGIDSFRNTRVISFSTHEGLVANEVCSVLAARDGRIWAGNHHALESLRDGKVFSILAKDGLPGKQVLALLEDHAGRLWVGIDTGLSVYEAGRFRPVRRSDGTPVGVVIAMAEDRDNNIWAEALGNPRKLIRIQDFTVREEIPAPQVPVAPSLVADPQEGIWLGLANGDLARYRQGRLEVFPFPHDQNGRVYQVAAMSDGSILGATASGLIGWKDGTLRTMTARNGLPCDTIYGLVSDAQDRLWLYSQCGLVLLENTELQAWWKDPDATVKVELFDVFDGARPSPPPFQPIASRGPDGRLWFANEAVIQMIDPAHLDGNALPPPVHIEKVVADRESYEPRQDLRIPPKPHNLVIDYTALSFVAPQKMRFRYRLEGHDADWQEAGTRRQAFYSDLPPGNYRFRVIACNNDGVWNEAGATLNFSIAPAWYQTGWFRLLCGVSALFIIWVLYRLRLQQVARAISSRFDERLAERTRIARELHDTLLQTVQGSKLVADDALEESHDPLQMRGAMEKLSGWLGQATQEGRAALNSLRTSTIETNDLAAGLRRATEECLLDRNMVVKFSVAGGPREMHPIARDEIYRIGYEAIRNACGHASASELEVSLNYAQDLILSVNDNGVGIEPAVVLEGKDGHFGLRGMRERAERIGSKLTIASSPNSGTEMRLVVPGNVIFRKASATRFERIKTFLGRRDGDSGRD